MDQDLNAITEYLKTYLGTDDTKSIVFQTHVSSIWDHFTRKRKEKPDLTIEAYLAPLTKHRFKGDIGFDPYLKRN